MSAEDLERAPLSGKQTELVRGRLLVREPPGAYHGRIAAKLAYLVGAFVYPNGLGTLFGQDTGFRIASNPDTVRAPDFAFVRAERASDIPLRGYAVFAPDLVVEIVSPDDRPGELLAKVEDWLEAGTRLVWVIDPGRAEARVHRADRSVAVVDAAGWLEGEPVLAGFRCALSEVLQ